MLFATITRRHRARRTLPGGPQQRLVVVRGGYRPDVIHARAGEPIRIVFRREETAHCSERVVFPAFGTSAMLPRGEEVVVELPPAPPGTYEFTCALNMLHGTLVVEE
jgi:plastocyanin domain-containing protein